MHKRGFGIKRKGRNVITSQINKRNHFLKNER